MKPIRLVAVAAVLTGAVLAVAFKFDAPASGSQERMQTVGEIHASLARTYDTVEALNTEATEVVLVRALARADRPYLRLPFTETRVVVEQSARGRLAPGMEIAVIETGGALPPGTVKTTNPVVRSPAEFALQGVPVLRVGERYLLFLRPFSGPMTTTKNAYIPVGEFQGKFRVSGDGTIRYHANPGVLTNGGPGFAVPQALEGRVAAQVMAEVRAR